MSMMSITNELEKIIANQESQILSYISSITYLIQELKEEREKKFKKFNNEECWIYSKTEDNHLETLACPVVISAKDLMEIIEEAGDELAYKLKSLQLHLEDIRSSVGILALTISKELGTTYTETNIGKKLRNLQDIFSDRELLGIIRAKE